MRSIFSVIADLQLRIREAQLRIPEGASIGVGNFPLADTGLALDRIDSAACQHRLLHYGETRPFAGRAGMFLDLLLHAIHSNLSGRLI